MNMNNIRVYDPEVKPYGGVQYFCDDKGRDWYESNKLFTKKYVVQTDSYNVVRAVVPSGQAEMLHPAGTTITEVNTLPKDFSLADKFWLFDGKKMVSTDSDPSIPTKYLKARASDELSLLITPLQDAVDLGEATEEEVEKYNALRKLRVKIMRISDDTPPGDVDWSEFTTA